MRSDKKRNRHKDESVQGPSSLFAQDQKRQKTDANGNTMAVDVPAIEVPAAATMTPMEHVSPSVTQTAATAATATTTTTTMTMTPMERVPSLLPQTAATTTTTTTTTVSAEKDTVKPMDVDEASSSVVTTQQRQKRAVKRQKVDMDTTALSQFERLPPELFHFFLQHVTWAAKDPKQSALSLAQFFAFNGVMHYRSKAAQQETFLSERNKPTEKRFALTRKEIPELFEHARTRDGLYGLTKSFSVFDYMYAGNPLKKARELLEAQGYFETSKGRTISEIALASYETLLNLFALEHKVQGDKRFQHKFYNHLLILDLYQSARHLFGSVFQAESIITIIRPVCTSTELQRVDEAIAHYAEGTDDAKKIAYLDLEDVKRIGFKEFCEALNQNSGYALRVFSIGRYIEDDALKGDIAAALVRQSGPRSPTYRDFEGWLLNHAAAIKIAEALSANNRLINLNLRGNSINDDGAVAIASAIAHHQNSQLVVLKLGGNNIGDTGAGAIVNALPKLRLLDLSYTNITDAGAIEIAKALSSEDCRLTHLNLEYTRISNRGKRAIAKAIVTAKRKYNRDIDHDCGLEGLDLFIKEARGEVGEVPADHCCHLVRMSNQDMIELAARLGSREVRYTRLSLKGSSEVEDINDEGAFALATALKSDLCPPITHLLLRGSKIGEDGAVALLQALPSSLEVFEFVQCSYDHWDNSNVDSAIGSEPAFIIADAIQAGELPHLRRLSLPYCASIREVGVAALAGALMSPNNSLRELNLEEVDMQDPDAIALSRALASEHCHLTLLNLEFNCIRFSGAIALARAMRTESCELITFKAAGFNREATSEAEDQQIEIAFALTHALAKQRGRDMTITGINLRPFDWCDIHDNAMENVVADLQSGNYRASHLHICSDTLTDQGIVELAEALKAPNPLTSLALCTPKMTDAGITAIAEALQSKECGITELVLLDDAIGEVGLRALAYTVLFNREVHGREIQVLGVAALDAFMKEDNRVQAIRAEVAQVVEAERRAAAEAEREAFVANVFA